MENQGWHRVATKKQTLGFLTQVPVWDSLFWIWLLVFSVLQNLWTYFRLTIENSWEFSKVLVWMLSFGFTLLMVKWWSSFFGWHSRRRFQKQQEHNRNFSIVVVNTKSQLYLCERASTVRKPQKSLVFMTFVGVLSEFQFTRMLTTDVYKTPPNPPSFHFLFFIFYINH